MSTITYKTDSNLIYSDVENLLTTYKNQRQVFERKWYDNNFFDDGLHFRYVSARTGKVVDQTDLNRQISPTRAIPKASLQIRGLANLLLGLEPHPSIYPEKIPMTAYPPQMDPMTGQMTNPLYEAALQAAKREAQRIGHWIENLWQEQDMMDKLAHMVLLSTKHGISFAEIYPDAIKERLKIAIFDAFDIYLAGNLTSIYDSPSIIKAIPTSIAEIKANELFDPTQRALISPDNKYASSEVKDAYMQYKFGNMAKADKQQTIILKEAFIKEYLGDDNWDRAKKLSSKTGAMEGKNKGDMIMRHTFCTSNGTLLDEYLPLKEYPFVDFRLEPGLVYQTPVMERMIPTNKSLDIAMSRIEGWFNTMIVGVWMRRKGENFQVNNMPGGIMVDYEGAPPAQMQPSSIPGFAFNFLQLLEQFIAEQGPSTAALGQLPQGVKSGDAIESVKSTEYANLKMATLRLKETVKLITERCIETAADYFYEPQTVMRINDDQPDYFDIIGEAGVKAYQSASQELPEVTVIKRDTKVRIEIESGLGYTIEGKKATMGQIVKFVGDLSAQGLVPPEAVKVLTKRFLDIFQFGATQEFMEAMDNSMPVMNQEQMAQMKIAIAETLQDLGLVGPQKEEEDIMKTKVGMIEAAQDLAGTGPVGGSGAQTTT